MDADLDNPYWPAIVGDHWPTIDPATWNDLAEQARAGGAAIDAGAFEQARRGFDQRVRASSSLEPVREALGEEGRRIAALTESFTLISHLLGEFGSLARDTRNGILDIVEEASARITELEHERTQRETTVTGDGDATEVRAELAVIRAAAATEIATVIDTAGAEVAAWVARARAGIGQRTDSIMAEVANLLGQPDLWDSSGGPTPVPVRGDGQGPPHPARQETSTLGSPKIGVAQENISTTTRQVRDREASGFETVALDRRPPNLERAPNSFPDPVDSRITPTGSPGPRPDAGAQPSDAAGAQPRAHTPITVHSPPYPGSATSPGQDPVGVAHDRDTGSAPQSSGSVSDVIGAGRVSDVAGVGGGREPVTAQPGSNTPGSGPSGASDLPPTADFAVTDAATRGAGGVDAAVTFAPGSNPADGPHSLSPASMVAGRSMLPPPATALAGTGSAQAGPRPVAGTLPGSPPDSGPARPVAGSPGVASASDTHPADSHATAARPVAGQPPSDTANTLAGESNPISNRADPVLVAAGSAVTDLAPADHAADLAQSVLARLLSATDDSPLAPGWAIAVFDHGDGLAAVVTSTEGRSWLPAGLYLPRALTTPWAWDAARDADWEGVADPARILTEFALLRERAVGARLLALASSRPIAETLRRALPQVSMREVAGSGDPVFAGPGPGLVDRLELTCSPRLLDRVEAVAHGQLGAKLHTLAHDAHTRLARANIGEAATLFGAPALRERLLTAHRDRTPIPLSWWEDLHDADALLAASSPALYLDASRIPLGDLRSRPHGGDLGRLRALTLQRRADELVLLLAHTPTMQTLRDATYAHTLVAEHPLLAPASPPTAMAPL
ncbi:hypothetical protein [Nocardia tengchongensis]|uniref:hypothetical protein n=1 Tax=Nocardia tengchongensis TaxID=2055889 RepID=UPI0036C57D27